MQVYDEPVIPSLPTPRQDASSAHPRLHVRFLHGEVDAAERVAVMCRIRWLVAGLALVYAASLLLLDRSHSVKLGLPAPAFMLALPLFIAAYNLLSRALSRRESTASLAVALALGGDLLATVIGMHGTGGNASWLWALYPLITLEAAYLTQRADWTVITAGLGGLFYGAELELERVGLLAVVPVPFENAAGRIPEAYLLLRLSWIVLMNAAAAIAGLIALEALTHAREALRSAYQRLEEQYVALGQLDRLKTNFLSTVSHELRTPLTIIQGNTELLEEDRGLSPESRARVAEAERGVTALSERIELMLSYATLASGEAPLSFEPTTARGLADLVLARCQAACRTAGVVLLVDLPPQELELEADTGRLADALVQLVSNARRASGSGGTVGLAVRAEGPLVSFRVWDTGPGLPPRVAARLGEPFTQAGVGLTEHQPGLGLGLALAQLVAALHGGTLVSEDTQGRGASLRLSVPRTHDS